VSARIPALADAKRDLLRVAVVRVNAGLRHTSPHLYATCFTSFLD
jgi:hypothetical protein